MKVLHVAAAGTCHTGLARFALLNMTAFAARAQKGVFPGSLEPQKLCEGLRRDTITDEIFGNRVATVVAADDSAAVVDAHCEVLAHAVAAAVEQTAHHHLHLLLWNHIKAVGTLHHVCLHNPCHCSRSSI